MNKPSDRVTNLFGALALGVADRLRRTATDGTELGGETAAALVVVGHAPGQSIHQLGQVLRLSQSGTVRLVDRLVASGLVQRTQSVEDRRTVALTLTENGKVQRAELLKRRRTTLEVLLGEIDADDYAAFERVVETLLKTMPDNATSALNVCRFCDEEHCPDCPMSIFGLPANEMS